MAITKIQQDALTNIEIQNTSQKNKSSSNSNLVDSKDTKGKKKSWFSLLTSEIKVVIWPKFGYVARWSIVIILFTAVFSSILGFVDHILGAGMSYANCNSPANIDRKSQEECTSDLVTKLTFRS